MIKESIGDNQNVNIVITRCKGKIKQMLTRVVTMIIMFGNIYQIFCPLTPLKHMLITNQYVA